MKLFLEYWILWILEQLRLIEVGTIGLERKFGIPKFLMIGIPS
jgi:hypothetical protein